MLLDILHEILNIFAGGRSSIRIALFFVYTIGFFILFFISKKTIWPSIKSTYIVLAFVLTILFTIPLFLHFNFFNNFSLPYRNYVVVVSGDELTSTRLIHNHVGKATVGYVSQFFYNKKNENIDYGNVYNNLINPGWSIFLLILLVILLILFTHIYLDQVKNVTRKKIFTFFYSLVTFVIVKDIFDGGILSNGAIINLGFFYFLVSNSELKNKIRYFSLCIFLYLSIHSLLLWKGFYINFFEFKNHLIAASVFLLFGLSFLLFIYKEKISRVIVLFIIFTSIAVIAQIMNKMNTIQDYKKMSIIKDQTYITSYNDIPNAKLLFKINTIGIYKIIDVREKTAGEYLEKNKVLSSFFSVTTEWVNCIPVSANNILSGDLNSIEKLSKNPVNNEWINVYIYDEKFITDKNLYSYKIKAILHPCANRYLNLLEESIKLAGGKTFFLFNPQIHNYRIPF
jgi:hypothetical protein